MHVGLHRIGHRIGTCGMAYVYTVQRDGHRASEVRCVFMFSDLEAVQTRDCIKDSRRIFGKAWRRSLRKCDPKPSGSASGSGSADKVDKDSKFFVKMTVTMPYTKSEFNEDKQDKYIKAVARAAGTNHENVEIVSITEKQRRAGSIDVETKVRALHGRW